MRFIAIAGYALLLATIGQGTAIAAEDAPASLRPDEQTRKPAKYPKDVCKAGIGGTVPLRVAVNGAGVANDIRVERTSGNRDLDRAAVKAAMHWRYLPAVVAGKKQSGIAYFSVEFDPQSDLCKKIAGPQVL
jgi:TonB family protein